MSRKIATKWIQDNAVTLAKIASSARTGILAGKTIAARRGVLNFAAAAASSSVVTTEVTAAAVNLIPRSDLTSGLGVFTGALSNGVADSKVVLVRIAGTNEGVDDGSNNEVYGVLSESSGVYTLSYKKSDGSSFTFPSTTNIDFYFVEIQDLSILSPDVLLYGSVTGVVDALHATTLAGHLNGGPNKHDASEIDVEGDGSYYDAGDLESALADLDAQLVIASGNASSALAAINAHTDGGANKHDATEIDYERSSGSRKDIQASTTEVESALSDLDDRKISRSGSIAFTGDQSFGSHNATNLADPVNPQDAATKNYVDDAVAASSSEEFRQEVIVLSGTNITDKYVDLAAVPKNAVNVMLVVMDGLEQDYGVDFTVITDGSDIKRLTWDTLASGGPSVGMVGDLAAADRLRVRYQVDA